MGIESHLYNKIITTLGNQDDRLIFVGAYYGMGWGYFQCVIVVDVVE